VNIGDIAHTPGMVRLLEQYIPEARLILWSNVLDRGVEEMLRRNFPRLRIVNGEPGVKPVDESFKEADFLVHGSGPSLVARGHVEAWRKLTHKPFGVFGLTIASPADAAPLTGASFVFTRETKSLDNVKQAGFSASAFAPDATFNLKLSDEKTAKDFLERHRLVPKKFIAIVPRLRYTPYHQMRKVDWTAEETERRMRVNEAHKEADHAKLREVITTWVRQTGHKVLLCPEMTYQLEIIGPLLYDPLPAEVRKQVVRRTSYWLPDEAASVYRRAAVVVSFECHSPIIAAVNDTPCIYVHQPEDGIKGQMWNDIGLNRWYFEVEQTTGKEIAARMMEIHAGYAAAQVDVHEAVLYARRLQSNAMMTVRRIVLS
jgi:polysaccharide pyruvyl transferase WcaK-like protein